MNKVETKEYNREYYSKNKNLLSEKKKIYYLKKRDHVSSYGKKYYSEHIKEKSNLNKKWREANPEKAKITSGNWYKENTEKARASGMERYRTNPEKWREYSKNRYRMNYRSNPQYRISRLLRTRLYHVIKGKSKSGSAIRDLGCSVEELTKHLEKQFQSGMTWGNQGEWHIDHIIPLASFDMENREQFLKACHYTNLQPLWAFDNISKGDKI
jgi:hypothetical protein